MTVHRSLIVRGVIKKRILFLCVAFSFLCIMAAKPSMAEQVRLTLTNAINTALQNNEDIEESFHRIAAARAGVMSSEGAYDLTAFAESRYSAFSQLDASAYKSGSLANPTVNYFRTDVGLSQRIATGATLRTFYTYSHETRLGHAGQDRHFNKSYLTVELAQSLLKGIGDKEARGAIKNAMLAVDDSLEGRSLAVSQITLAVIRAYWSLAIAQNNLKIGKRILRMAEEVLRREHVRYKEGISQGVDVERANLAVKQRRYTTIQYERDAKTAKDYLLLLMNSPKYTFQTDILPITPPIKSGISVPNEATAMTRALAERYEIKQAAIVLKQLNIEYDVNQNKLLPQLDLVLGGTTNSGNDYLRAAEGFSDTDQRPSGYVGLTFSFPLQNREARGNFDRTKRLISIAHAQLEKTRRSIATEVKGVLYNFVMAKQGIPVAQQAYNLARSVVSGERSRFEMGGINNRDLLASHDALGREEMNYFVAYVNYNVALAEYRFACATMLEKYNIHVTEQGASIR